MAEIVAGPDRLAPEAWALLGVALENSERTDDARRALQESRALAPDRTDTLLFLAELERDAGNTDAAIGHYRALLAAAPGAAQQALDLGRLLAAGDAYQEVVDLLLPFRGHVSVELRLMLARALFETERHAEVVGVTGPLVRDAELELRGTFMTGEHRGELIAHMREATELHDDSFATLHGRERVIEADVHRGRLVANSGANYRLLGEARMAIAPAWTPDTALRDVDGTVLFGQALIAGGEGSRGLCHLGVAALRRHNSSQARDLFEKARDLDDDNFAAFLGIGAAIDHDKSGALARIARLPEAPGSLSPALAAVLVDWPVLTPGRTRLGVRGGRAPRAPAPGDRNGWGNRPRPADRRPSVPISRSSATAVANVSKTSAVWTPSPAPRCPRCALRRSRSSSSLSGERGWVFGHELAHLVHFHLPDERCDELEALFEEIDAQEFGADELPDPQRGRVLRGRLRGLPVRPLRAAVSPRGRPGASRAGVRLHRPALARRARGRGGAGRGGARPRSARSRGRDCRRARALRDDAAEVRLVPQSIGGASPLSSIWTTWPPSSTPASMSKSPSAFSLTTPSATPHPALSEDVLMENERIPTPKETTLARP